MKKSTLALLACLIALALAGCGNASSQSTGTGSAAAEVPVSVQQSDEAPAAQQSASEAPASVQQSAEAPAGDGAVTSGAAPGEASPAQAAARGASPLERSLEEGGQAAPVDLDLTAISGTVVYSQVFDMTVNPGQYMGRRIRLRGAFNYFQDPETLREYFAAIIADATACCAQGIEFVWAGEHTYPRDYPPLNTNVIVTGTFNTYEENGLTYIQLTDAEVTW